MCAACGYINGVRDGCSCPLHRHIMVEMRDVAVVNCSSGYLGGGMLLYGVNATCTECNMQHCTASSGANIRPTTRSIILSHPTYCIVLRFHWSMLQPVEPSIAHSPLLCCGMRRLRTATHRARAAAWRRPTPPSACTTPLSITARQVRTC